MNPDVCYLDWDPKRVNLLEPFRKAIQPAIQEERDGYIRLQGTAERVTAVAEKYGQTGVKITKGQALSR